MTSKYPTIRSIRGKHNHAQSTVAMLRHRDLSDDIKLKFIKLFRHCYSAESALQCHKIDLMLEYGDNYYRIGVDGKYLPSYSVVNHLFKKEFQKEYGQYSEGEMLPRLKEQLGENTEKTGGIAEFKYTSDKNHYFVVICAAIMLRAHAKLPQTNELVMVDTSGGIDKEWYRIYFFVTPCAAGSIPLVIFCN
ncbi:hypothetical protein AVEN_50582-1 [Araneus ventricosus]|uniref:Uncharacterized protein n=1 Tax=Araneus ventricosus TaxID=182803 RepID=A0A4Y2AS99_ARAVE|nr:hypothetical protein AVEN_50582-1 [Araneus ventricosus]